MNLNQEQWQTILAALTIVSAVWYSAKRFGSLETLIAQLATSVDTQSTELKRNTETTTEIRVATESLRVAMVGLDGQNGMASQVRALKQELAALKHHVSKDTE